MEIYPKYKILEYSVKNSVFQERIALEWDEGGLKSVRLLIWFHEKTKFVGCAWGLFLSRNYNLQSLRIGYGYGFVRFRFSL